MIRILGSIIAVTAAVALLLRLLNGIPPLLQESTVTAFSSIEEAERKLHIRILLPAYFPEAYSWPPREITMNRSDPPSISIVFSSRKEGKEGLLVQEFFTDSNSELKLSSPRRIIRESQGIIGKSKANIREGVSENGKSWVQIQWKMPDRIVVITSDDEKEEILRMAKSMH